MKQLTLCITLLISTFTSPAQDFQWARRGGSTNNLQSNADNNNVIDMVTDAADNVYLLCRVGANNLQVDGNSLNAYSSVGIGASNDIVLASFSKEGTYRWSKALGGVSRDIGAGLKILNGKLYLSGIVYNLDSSFISTDTLLYHAYNGYYAKWAFLVQYDTSGVFQWLQMPGGEDTVQIGEEAEYPYWIDVAANGDVYWLCDLVPGCLPNTSQPITQRGTYVLRYSNSGQLISRVKLETEHGVGLRYSGSFNEGNFIRDPQTGNFYLGGTHDYPTHLLIGGDTIRGAMYLACFDNTGQLLWKKESVTKPGLFNVNTTNLNDFELDANGNLLITGSSRSGDTIFNGIVFSSPKIYESAYILKLSSSGNTIWSKMSVSDPSLGFGLAVGQSEFAIAGYHHGIYWPGPNDKDTLAPVLNQGHDAFIARFDIQTGDLLSMQSAETNFGSESYGYSIATDSEGGYYLGGNYSAQLYLGPDTLYKIGSQRSFFVSKYACTIPEASFAQSLDSSAYVFAYTGTPADSVHWDFGDGSAVVAGDTVAHTYSATGQYIVCATSYDACGDTTFCDTVDVTKVSLYEVLASRTSIYPNPAKDVLHVSNPQDYTSYHLLSLSGKLMQKGELTEVGIDLKEIQSGIYILQLQSRDGVMYNQRIMKE